MKKGGWVVDGAPEHAYQYAEFCGGLKTFYGYKYASAVGFVKATFKGSGTGTLDFGNCYFTGVTKVYLNNSPIGIANSNEKSVVISFDYQKGDVLKITEEGIGILRINSLKLRGCEKEGKTIIAKVVLEYCRLKFKFLSI